MSPRNVPALLLALSAASAYAEPYRPLPRLPPGEVKGRAADSAKAQRALSHEAPTPPPVATAEPALNGGSQATPAGTANQPGVRAATSAAAAPSICVVVPMATPVAAPAAATAGAGAGSTAPTPVARSESDGLHVVTLPGPSGQRSAPTRAEVIPVPDEAVPQALSAAASADGAAEAQASAAPPGPGVAPAVDPVAVEVAAPDPQREAAEAARRARIAELGTKRGEILGEMMTPKGFIIQRTLDDAGRVLERVLDGRGELMDVMPVAYVRELPLVGTLRDEAGQTMRVVRDASGALIDLVLDRSGKLVSARVLGGRGW